MQFNMSALHFASKNGHAEIVKELLENGANMNAINGVCTHVARKFKYCDAFAQQVYVYLAYVWFNLVMFHSAKVKCHHQQCLLPAGTYAWIV